ncbi:MAG TPA: hypothetical protein VMB80_02925 [Candidatus Acidoferrum sp.]|nr:hypothetical protein [Candidatus Acidoferrum sp.]
MVGTGDPNQIVGGLGVGLLLLGGLWRLIGWIREAPVHPDPWDAEVQQKLEDPDIQEVCRHCSTPLMPGAWFCECCGSAVGPYNNLMPYVNAFSEGEVFRNGVANRLRNKPIILVGYLLISLGSYAVFAPLYWFFLLSNLKRQSSCIGADAANKPES